MAHAQPPSTAPDVRPIYRLVRRTRALLRSSWLIAGLALTLGLAAATLVGVTGLDLLWPLSPGLRLTGLLLVVLPTAWVFVMGMLRPMCRRLTPGGVARRIESHLPGIHNRLVSCIDLSSEGQGVRPSAAFYRRLVREAIDRSAGFRPRQVVDFSSLRRSCLFALASAVAFGLGMLLFSDRLPTAMARIIYPFADIPPASGVAYTVAPGDARVLRDEDILFTAQVTRGEPKSLRLEMRSEAGDKTIWRDLDDRNDGRWTATIRGLDPGFENTFTYRVHGGGTWSRAYRIAVIDRPIIALVRTVLHYPQYMALEPRPNPAGTLDVGGPTGSDVEVIVESEGNVARGAIQLCQWRTAGKERELVVTGSLPMHGAGKNLWSGRFPLRGDGLYRVELRNELDYPNQTMHEAKYHALPDLPPQVTLERPGADVVLSTPERIPLLVHAADDYGLDRVVLTYQRNGAGAFTELPLKNYPRPMRSDRLAGTFDLAALKLKIGEGVRYRIEAYDRKGQVARTPDFSIRIANDPNAADRELTNLDKGTDTFQEKLSRLITEQAKVHSTVATLQAKYAKLDKAIQEARTKTEAEVQSDAQKNAARQPLRLDPTDSKSLEELRKELSQLAGKENQNVQLGQQVKADLDRLADQTRKSRLLPADMAREMAALQEAFQRLAMNPLQQLQSDMQQGAVPQHSPPDLHGLKQRSDRLQKDLETMKARMEALAKARQELRDHLESALAQLKNELLKLNAGLTARDLEDLRNALAALRAQLKQQAGQQQRLYQQTQSASDADLAAKARSQADLEKQLASLLERVKKLQAAGKLKRMRRPTFPKAPYTPEDDEQFVRPNEEDPDEPAAQKNAQGHKTASKGAADKDNEEEPMFIPALGGPKPKIDPRYAKKVRPLKHRPHAKPGDPENMRADLENRQNEHLGHLSEADQSLASDEQALEGLLDQLQQALTGQPGVPHEGHGEDAPMSALAQLLQSAGIQEAMAMAARMHQMAGMPSSGRPTMPGQYSPEGNLQGGTIDDPALDAELNRLPLDMRTAILHLQPRLREQLLQGMRERGPEGYRGFIDEYFKRLTETKSK